MNKQARRDSLLPEGVPKYVRCYDSGPDGSFDRYTVCYSKISEHYEGVGSVHFYVGMSANPFHPQGFGQHGETRGQHCDVNKWGFAPAMGRRCRLGKRIPFGELPEDCRALVLSDYTELWNLQQ